MTDNLESLFDSVSPALSKPVMQCGADHSPDYRDALESPKEDFLMNFPESLSPRLAWMRKHNIITHYSDHENDWVAIRPFKGDEKKSAGEILSEHGESTDMGFGDSEDEAIASMARNI